MIFTLILGIPAYRDASLAMEVYQQTSYNPLTWDVSAMRVALELQAIAAEEIWYDATFEEIFEVDFGAYPTSNPIDNEMLLGKTEGLNQVFLGRLAKLAEDLGVPAVITSGLRDDVEQLRMVNYWLAKGPKYALRADGAAYEVSSGNVMAAAPGKSRHRLSIAADLSTDAGTIYEVYGKISNSELEEYGLHKPISYEDWHFEPIETKKGR
jgi:hypothetical protein